MIGGGGRASAAQELREHGTQGAAAGLPHEASAVPLRRIAVATAVACVVAQLLARLGGPSASHEAPLAIVLGQNLWNAAQVGLLLLLLGLWTARRSRGTALLTVAVLAALPFSIYAVSPGAALLSLLLALTCAVAWKAPSLGVSIVDTPAGQRPAFGKLELLGLACYLLSSMYNYNASRGFFPEWASLYANLGALIGFAPSLDSIANTMFTLGLSGVSMPEYVTAGRNGSPFGAVVFTLIWTVLPVLYILYFGACAMLASKSPGAWVQRALCLYCIAHFLFLTDVVDYQFGRGVENPGADWAHWSERFVWRIAVLLPIYQKLTAGDWLRDNGRTGVVVHYVMLAWALGFFVYQVLIYDLIRFFSFATGGDDCYTMELFGIGYRQELGYHGALVLMVFLYGFMVLRMRCKRISAATVTSA